MPIHIRLETLSMTWQRRKPLIAKIGLYGVGHHTYWGQYPGLKDELLGYLRDLETKMQALGADTINFGMADEARSAYAAARQIAASDIDLLMVDMLTYATSATWAIICREVRVPIVLVCLQPDRALDYANATIYRQLVNDPICAAPEFAGVAERLGRPIPPVVIGTVRDDVRVSAELARWVKIAHVLHDLHGARLGHMGHSLEAMLDMHFDATAFTTAFGLHVVQTEPDDVVARFREVPEADLGRRKQQILSFFDAPGAGTDPDAVALTDEDLVMAARAYAALEAFIDEKALDGLAYYYEAHAGSDTQDLVTNFIVGNSILTAQGFPMCGESDLKTCVAMLIMDRLEAGGSLAEFHPIDFNEGFVLVGHDGPHHLNVAEGRPVLRSLKQYHGKPGHGASVEFNLKVGPITMLCISQTRDGRFKFIVAEGQSAPGAIPATGNTNTRGVFKPDVVTFLKRWLAEGPTHHFSLGVGHQAETISELARCLNIECAVVAND